MNILKAFEEDDQKYDLTILGTYDKPLFKANEVAKILGITNITTSMTHYTDKEKVYIKHDTISGLQNTMFLTEFGLYKLMFRSKKPLAEKFQYWVFSIIEEIRKNGKYELDMAREIDRKLLQGQKEREIQNIIIDNYKNKNVVYLSKIDEKAGKTIIKIGSSHDIKKRAPQLALEFGKSIILKAYICSQNTKFESFLHKEFKDFRYNEPINNKLSRELFIFDDENYEKLLTTISNNLYIYDSDSFEQKIQLKKTENETIRLEKEKLMIEKEIKKIEMITQNPSLFLNKEIKKEHDNKDITHIPIEKLEDIKIEDLQVDESSDKEELECDEDDETYPLSAFQPKKYINRKVPKVQQYHPKTLEYIKTFDSIIETVRYFYNELHIETFSNKTLKDAYRGNYVYAGYRWNIIDHNIEDKPYKIPETVKVFTTRRDLLARLNLDKTKILEVYPSQKHAAIAMKHNSPSAICKALKLETLSQGHYWKFYDDCDERLKNDYIQNGGIIPEVAKTISGAKSIKQIDYETKKVIQTYSTIKDVQVKYNISRASLKSAIENKSPHNGFYWAYA
jgi:prophage antirepressor-like protein